MLTVLGPRGCVPMPEPSKCYTLNIQFILRQLHLNKNSISEGHAEWVTSEWCNHR